MNPFVLGTQFPASPLIFSHFFPLVKSMRYLSITDENFSIFILVYSCIYRLYFFFNLNFYFFNTQWLVYERYLVEGKQIEILIISRSAKDKLLICFNLYFSHFFSIYHLLDKHPVTLIWQNAEVQYYAI